MPAGIDAATPARNHQIWDCWPLRVVSTIVVMPLSISSGVGE